MKAIMKRVLGIMICALFCNWLNAGPVFSAELNDFVLDDGSVIRAEIISFQDRKYTLRSDSLGVFSIDAARIEKVLRYKTDQSSAPLAAASFGSGQAAQFSSSSEMFQANIEETKAMLMKDPEAMRVVASMASDPNFRELLDDPAVVAALKSGDMATLLKNPRFLAIMQDPKMQELATKVRDKSKE